MLSEKEGTKVPYHYKEDVLHKCPNKLNAVGPSPIQVLIDKPANKSEKREFGPTTVTYPPIKGPSTGPRKGDNVYTAMGLYRM